MTKMGAKQPQVVDCNWRARGVSLDQLHNALCGREGRARGEPPASGERGGSQATEAEAAAR
jgi:hypothetical protein